MALRHTQTAVSSASPFTLDLTHQFAACLPLINLSTTPAPTAALPSAAPCPRVSADATINLGGGVSQPPDLHELLGTVLTEE